MPKYEYACKSCGDRLEVVQSFTDDPMTVCVACGGPLRKVFTPPGIAFKGRGFYRTDNRKRRTEPKADASADASAVSSANGKTETKADAKPEPAKKESAPAAESKPKAAVANTA